MGSRSGSALAIFSTQSPTIRAARSTFRGALSAYDKALHLAALLAQSNHW
jgi:hypothetical protein